MIAITSERDWVSVEELAHMLELSRATVISRNSRGLNPPRYKAGRQVRYRRQDVTEWLESGRVHRKTATNSG